MNISRAVLTTALALGIAGPMSAWAAKKQRNPAKATPVRVIDLWSGKMANESLHKLAPPEGFVLSQEPWERLWKAWRSEEPVPEVDFQRQMVLVFTASGPNNVGCNSVTLDRQGNLQANAMSTLIAGPGFGYLLLCVPREGVKSVNGNPLPGVTQPPKKRRPGRPGEEPGAVPGSSGSSSPGEPGVAEGSEDSAPYPGPGVVQSSPSPIFQLEGIRPKRSAELWKSSWEKPFVLKSKEEAAAHFTDAELAKLTGQVDFGSQFVLLFAWRGSGQDRLDYAVGESFPEQVFFSFKRGLTRDLREHIQVYALRSDVKWSVKQRMPGRNRGPSPDTPVQSSGKTRGASPAPRGGR